MKQEVDSKGKMMLIEMNDLWLFKRKVWMVERWWQQMKGE